MELLFGWVVLAQGIQRTHGVTSDHTLFRDLIPLVADLAVVFIDVGFMALIDGLEMIAVKDVPLLSDRLELMQFLGGIQFNVGSVRTGIEIHQATR